MGRIAILALLFIFILPHQIFASYAAIDSHTARILFSSNPHARQPIASLTKIWTALVVLENASLSEKVTVSKKATMSEGSSIYLKEGEQLTVEELLYGLMLRSGNDAAMALAEHVAGSEEGFVYLMNERAMRAGLRSTYFMNASGLHHPQHLSTAYETALMLKIAMENEKFRKIASTAHYNGKDRSFENKHKLVVHTKEAVAGKTGYTKVAGRTLATYFSIREKDMVIVTLNESNDWLFHAQLASKIDEEFERVEILPARTYDAAHFSIKLNEPVSLLLRKDEKAALSHALIQPTTSIRPIAIWQIRLGNVPIYQFPIELTQK